MEHYGVVLFILAIMVILSAVSESLKLPAPILLILAGIGIGFIPVIPKVELEPEVIFLLFLPPLLYDAAFNMEKDAFRVHFNTITTLGVSLVFLSTLGIAIVARYLIPGFTWPLAFVLGAILSATDAVAAMGVTSGLGLTQKTKDILEGESLVNDASALVAYRFSVAAVAGTGFVWWQAGLAFVRLMIGGVLVGLVMGRLFGLVLRQFPRNNLVIISFILLIPFITYLFAEAFQVSGVLAVVVLGLSMGHLSRKVFPEHLKQQSRNFWSVMIYLLNGLIFLLIGLQFPYIVQTLDERLIVPYIGYAVIITLAALLMRMARVFLQQVNLERAFVRQHKRVKEEALLDIRTSLIVSWSGMRGIVSLAIAIGLPLTLTDGTAFPQRNAIIFISVAVVLITLLGQGLTLPWLVRKLAGKQNDKQTTTNLTP
ncbi:Na+/H+ antiporter [Flavihumibacter petaseus]|uniref:Putative CPA1 family transporter n=1 Tax=Flavihumibacter petaseus NBRC 106054 TaxID=1220578 RepID=A0A0E9N582_9BACT|nr:Na+/H+ antiporter [Flavihumibacter petaseus]GAO44856.1 putative CPA1 family transporter [Flavihumibacter petaseus NBRC 106054]